MMSRRITRRGSTRLSATSPQRILRLGPTCFLDADHYTQSGGNVVGFVDQSRSNTMVSAGTAMAVPTASASFNGAKVATFAGVSWFESSLAASNWKFLSDGAGSEFFHVFAPTTVGVGTRMHVSTKAGGAVGIGLYEGVAVSYFDVTGTAITVLTALVTGAVVNTPYVLDAYYQEGRAGNEYSLTRNATATTGDSLLAPTDANPAHTLILGALNNSGTYATAELWACTIIFPRVLTTAERAVVRAWIAAKYGIAP